MGKDERYGRSKMIEAHGEIRHLVDAQARFEHRRYEHDAKNDGQLLWGVIIAVSITSVLAAGFAIWYALAH